MMEPLDIREPVELTPVKYELVPSDPFDSVIIDMIDTNRKKRADYAGAGNPLQNFYDSAYLTNDSAGKSVEVLLATKASRLRTLLAPTASAPKNESVEDTLLDRAVYSVLALALYRAGGYESQTAVVASNPAT